jgi:hypothetical protein
VTIFEVPKKQELVRSFHFGSLQISDCESHPLMTWDSVSSSFFGYYCEQKQHASSFLATGDVETRGLMYRFANVPTYISGVENNETSLRYVILEPW